MRKTLVDTLSSHILRGSRLTHNRSLRTWTKNNKKNGYEFDPESLGFRDFFDDSDQDKVLDLGMVRIPVCHVNEARRNWGFPSESQRREFYPC